MLSDQVNRTVQIEFQTQEENTMAMQVVVKKLSQDKRKHEWVLVNKENMESTIGKVVKKRKKSVLINHWDTFQAEEESCSGLVECKKCSLDDRSCGC